MKYECQNSGKKVVIKENNYYCNNTLVTKQIYDAQVSLYNCNTTIVYREACYCPADQNGNLCE